MLNRSRLLLKTISLIVVVSFFVSDLSYAAPASVGAIHESPLQVISSDPTRFEPPPDFCTLKEIHAGEMKGGVPPPLLIHIQDAHSNLSGQQNLASTLDEIMKKYKVTLVLVEGGSIDGTLTPLKELTTAKICKRVAKALLMEGRISGEEYLNLISDHPMKIMGIEDMPLYFKSVENYGLLAGKREAILEYLKLIQRALGKLKNKFYPEELLAYEKQKLNGQNGSANSNETNFKELFRLAESKQVNLKDFPNVQKIQALQLKEAQIDFNLANLEQAALIEEIDKRGGGADLKTHLEKISQVKNQKASQLAYFQNTFSIAQKNNVSFSSYPNLLSYVEYLKDFCQIDLDQLLEEFVRLEDQVYLAVIASERSNLSDALLVRSIDRYLTLLETAYRIQMSTSEFELFKVNEPDFATTAYLAFINRKLAELGYFEDLLSYKNLFEEGKTALEAFYDSVNQRDLAFMKNAERILKEENQQAAVLISGGYHTPHLKELFKDKGYSYAVLAPIVTSPTNQKKYESLLLEPIKKINGNGKPRTALENEMVSAKKKTEGVREMETLQERNLIELDFARRAAVPRNSKALRRAVRLFRQQRLGDLTKMHREEREAAEQARAKLGGARLADVAPSVESRVPSDVAKGLCVTGDTLLPIVREAEGGSSKVEGRESINVPIKYVKAGDLVLSLNEQTQQIEPHRIKGLLDMGIKPVYKLTTASGRSIKTTANHPYLVKERGWIKVKHLKVGDEIGVPALPATYTVTRFLNYNPASDQLFRRNLLKKVFNERQDLGDGQKKYPEENNSALGSDGEAHAIGEIKVFGDQNVRFFFDQFVNLLVGCAGYNIANIPNFVALASQHIPNGTGTISVDKEFHKESGRVAGELLLVGKERGVKDAGLYIFSRDGAIFFLDFFEAHSGGQRFKDDMDRHTGPFNARFPTVNLGVCPNPFFKINLNHLFIASLLQVYRGFSNSSRIVYLLFGLETANAAELTPSSITQSCVLWDPIVSIEYQGSEQVYDIEVEGTHNFIGNGIFAHNTVFGAVAGPQLTAGARMATVGSPEQRLRAMGGMVARVRDLGITQAFFSILLKAPIVSIPLFLNSLSFHLQEAIEFYNFILDSFFLKPAIWVLEKSGEKITTSSLIALINLSEKIEGGDYGLVAGRRATRYLLWQLISRERDYVSNTDRWPVVLRMLGAEPSIAHIGLESLEAILDLNLDSRQYLEFLSQASSAIVGNFRRIGGNDRTKALALLKRIQSHFGGEPAWIKEITELLGEPRNFVDEEAPESDEYYSSKAAQLIHFDRFEEPFVKTFVQIGTPAVPYLRGLLENRDISIQKIAIVILGSMGPAASDAAPDIFKIMRESPAPLVQIAAATSLVKIGSFAKEVIPILISALESKDKGVRDVAFAVLLDIGQEAIPAILEFLKSMRDSELKRYYLKAFTQIIFDSLKSQGVLDGLYIGSRQFVKMWIYWILDKTDADFDELKNEITQNLVPGLSRLQSVEELPTQGAEFTFNPDTPDTNERISLSNFFMDVGVPHAVRTSGMEGESPQIRILPGELPILYLNLLMYRRLGLIDADTQLALTVQDTLDNETLFLLAPLLFGKGLVPGIRFDVRPPGDAFTMADAYEAYLGQTVRKDTGELIKTASQTYFNLTSLGWIRPWIKAYEALPEETKRRLPGGVGSISEDFLISETLQLYLQWLSFASQAAFKKLGKNEAPAPLVAAYEDVKKEIGLFYLGLKNENDEPLLNSDEIAFILGKREIFAKGADTPYRLLPEAQSVLEKLRKYFEGDFNTLMEDFQPLFSRSIERLKKAYFESHPEAKEPIENVLSGRAGLELSTIEMKVEGARLAAKQVLPFMEAVKSPDAEVRYNAIKDLGERGVANKEELAALREARNDRNPSIKKAAEQVFVDPLVVVVIEGNVPEVRYNAINDLAKKANEDRIGLAVPALMTALKDENPSIRRAALTALSQIRAGGLPLVLDLMDMLEKDPTADNRTLTAEYFEKLGVEAKPAIPVLLNATEDAEPSVRAAAIKALEKINEAVEAEDKENQGRPGSPPARAPVPPDKKDSSVPFDDYRPVEWTAPSVLAYSLDTTPIEDRPMNKIRTGLTGRGGFRNFGANNTGDPILATVHPVTGQLIALTILRPRDGKWAIPGGFVDKGEGAEYYQEGDDEITKERKDAEHALIRELREETSAEFQMGDFEIIHEGPVHGDSRETDNAYAWTLLGVKIIPYEQAMKLQIRAGDDAGAIRWMPVTEKNLSSFYASHGEFFGMVISRLKLERAPRTERRTPSAERRAPAAVLGARLAEMTPEKITATIKEVEDIITLARASRNSDSYEIQLMRYGTAYGLALSLAPHAKEDAKRLIETMKRDMGEVAQGNRTNASVVNLMFLLGSGEYDKGSEVSFTDKEGLLREWTFEGVDKEYIHFKDRASGQVSKFDRLFFESNPLFDSPDIKFALRRLSSRPNPFVRINTDRALAEQEVKIAQAEKAAEEDLLEGITAEHGLAMDALERLEERLLGQGENNDAGKLRENIDAINAKIEAGGTVTDSDSLVQGIYEIIDRNIKNGTVKTILKFRIDVDIMLRSEANAKKIPAPEVAPTRLVAATGGVAAGARLATEREEPTVAQIVLESYPNYIMKNLEGLKEVLEGVREGIVGSTENETHYFYIKAKGLAREMQSEFLVNHKKKTVLLFRYYPHLPAGRRAGQTLLWFLLTGENRWAGYELHNLSGRVRVSPPLRRVLAEMTDFVATPGKEKGVSDSGVSMVIPSLSPELVQKSRQFMREYFQSGARLAGAEAPVAGKFGESFGFLAKAYADEGAVSAMEKRDPGALDLFAQLFVDNNRQSIGLDRPFELEPRDEKGVVIERLKTFFNIERKGDGTATVNFYTLVDGQMEKVGDLPIDGKRIQAADEFLKERGAEAVESIQEKVKKSLEAQVIAENASLFRMVERARKAPGVNTAQKVVLKSAIDESAMTDEARLSLIKNSAKRAKEVAGENTVMVQFIDQTKPEEDVVLDDSDKVSGDFRKDARVIYVIELDRTNITNILRLLRRAQEEGAGVMFLQPFSKDPSSNQASLPPYAAAFLNSITVAQSEEFNEILRQALKTITRAAQFEKGHYNITREVPADPAQAARDFDLNKDLRQPVETLEQLVEEIYNQITVKNILTPIVFNAEAVRTLLLAIGASA